MWLRTLENQSYAKHRYEVVVDNASDEDISSVVAKFNRFDVRVVEESRIGSYAARNKGLSVASGEVIAFRRTSGIALAPSIDSIDIKRE